MYSTEFKIIEMQIRFIAKKLDDYNSELKRLNDLLANVKRIEVEKIVEVVKEDWDDSLWKGPNDWS